MLKMVSCFGDGNGLSQAILGNYWCRARVEGCKPVLATTFMKQNLDALKFCVDTIKTHKIQPPGVMGWNDVSNNESYMAGKLVSTNNGASLYYPLARKNPPLRERPA